MTGAGGRDGGTATPDADASAGGRGAGGNGPGGNGSGGSGTGGNGGSGTGGSGTGGNGIGGGPGTGGRGAGGNGTGGRGAGGSGIGGSGTGGTIPIQYTVTVSPVSIGGGTGRVTSAAIAGGTPSQIDCGSTCTTTVPPLANIVLTAAPNPGFYFSSWGGACAGNTGPECRLTVSGTSTVTAKFTIANKMFVSSKTYTLSALGAFPGAANQCNVLATAAGLSGTFIPLLRDDTNNTFSQRIDAAPNGRARGWLRIDGKPFLDAWDVNTTYYSPEIDETGRLINDPASFAVVYAPTSPPCGTNQPEVGVPTGGGSAWLFYGQSVCGDLFRIYCFQIDYSAILTFPKATGWNIFVTDEALGAVDPAGGLAAADAVCRTQATMGHLPGSYRAMLATNTATVASRFTSVAATQPLVRPDGVLVATRASNLFQAGGSRLLSTLTVNALGATIERLVVTGLPQAAGSDFASSLGIDSSTCSNWTTASSAVFRNGGSPRDSNFFYNTFVEVSSACGMGPALANVACLQYLP